MEEIKSEWMGREDLNKIIWSLRKENEELKKENEKLKERCGNYKTMICEAMKGGIKK